MIIVYTYMDATWADQMSSWHHGGWGYGRLAIGLINTKWSLLGLILSWKRRWLAQTFFIYLFLLTQNSFILESSLELEGWTKKILEKGNLKNALKGSRTVLMIILRSFDVFPISLAPIWMMRLNQVLAQSILYFLGNLHKCHLNY